MSVSVRASPSLQVAPDGCCCDQVSGLKSASEEIRADLQRSELACELLRKEKAHLEHRVEGLRQELSSKSADGGEREAQVESLHRELRSQQSSLLESQGIVERLESELQTALSMHSAMYQKVWLSFYLC